MENCIFDDRNNNSIGFYSDLRTGLVKQVGEFMESKDYEMASDLCDLLLDLETYSEYEGLLVMSDNNGMGYTIRKYEGEK